VSRLDSFIRRLEAQRACLGLAAALVRGIEGPALELGLGNGRTYDHLRELCPDREIFVCERRVAAHPDCIPPREFLLLGDMRETLPALAGQLGDRVALAHLDPGTGDVAANRALSLEIARMVVPLLRLGGILVSESAAVLPEFASVALPAGVQAGRYHIYRRVNARSSP
jgi:hypothetical protein